MGDRLAGIELPDSELVRQAAALVREATDDVLYDHSARVFWFGMIKSRAAGVEPDVEAAYVGCMFHDLGLTSTYAREAQRFEMDGADVAYDFLRSHGWDEHRARDVWLGIALHTTPEIPTRLSPEVHVVTLGVETDVLGVEIGAIPDDQREQVLAAHPRPNFKREIVEHFYEGMKHRPGTTFGTMNDDVIAHFEPGFERENFVAIIEGNDWPE